MLLAKSKMLSGHGMFLFTQRNAGGYNGVFCCQDQDVIRTRECCCEPIKMNIVARVIFTICMGWNKDVLLTYRLCLFIGKGFQFYLLQNFELPLHYIKKVNFFWQCKDLEILKL